MHLILKNVSLVSNFIKISLTHVVFEHFFQIKNNFELFTMLMIWFPSDNMEFRRVIEKDFLFQTISNGAYSVDTFFFASGLLVSFLYFRTNAKGKLDPLTKGKKGFSAGFLHFFGLVFYRFLRLVSYLLQVSFIFFIIFFQINFSVPSYTGYCRCVDEMV